MFVASTHERVGALLLRFGVVATGSLAAVEVAAPKAGPFELLAFFKPWLALAAILATIALAVRGARTESLVLGIVALLQIAGTISPLLGASGGHRAEATPPRAALRVATWNAMRGEGDVAGMARLLARERVDIVALQESPPEVVRSIAAALRGAALGPTSGNVALVVAERLLLAGPGCAPFAERADPRMIVASVCAPSRDSDVVHTGVAVIHAASPRSPAALARRNNLLSAVPALLPRADPLVVAGDFNAPVWSARLGELMAAAGLSTHSGPGLARPTRIFRLLPDWFGSPIDHVFGRGYTAISRRLTPAFGSDHRAVIVDLAVAAQSM